MHFKKLGVFLCVAVLAVGMVGCGSPEPGAIDQELAVDSYEEDKDFEQNTAGDTQTTMSDSEVESTGTTGEVSGTEGTMTVRFLDVGQGNSVLVECDGRYMLVDGGDYDYSSYVVAYLKKQGVETLDYMVVSHYDSDHLSGCVGAMRVFDCELIICPDYEGDTKTYDTFISDMAKYEIAHVNPEVGETYTLGDAMFTIVCPEEYDYSDENDNSVGIRLEHGQNSFLICGDAGEESEEDMLESGVYLQSDVYMAGHHGSSGSSTYDFLQAVDPEVVVISCGYDNSYGHPAKATMNRLQKTGAELYRTDLQGELIAVSDGSTITWNVAACTDFRCGEDVAADDSINKSNSGSSNSGNSGSANAAVSGGNTSGNNQTSENDTYEASSKTTYVLNTNSGKFHLPSCDSVDDMSPENRKEVTESFSQMESKGYSPCKRCLK